MRFFGRQLDELDSDRALKIFGALLGLAHVLTGVFWFVGRDVPHLLRRGAEPICWPFWSSCHRYRYLDAPAISGVLVGYIVLGAACAACFMLVARARSRKRTAVAYTLLAVASALHVLVLVQDFRLRMNQNYMLNWVLLVFLVVPGKRNALRALLVLFYVWAGLLKLNHEWLSGAGLGGELPFPAAIVPAACAYVIVLELVVSFGLLSRRPIVFWASLAQLVIFHLTSWWVVGFYYPLLMFLLVAAFPLFRGAPVRPVHSPRVWLLVAVFSVFQLIPHVIPGDTALTGEGRMFALHMFDARVVCDARATTHWTTSDRVIDLKRDIDIRIACDPIVFVSRADALCRKFAGLSSFHGLDLDVRARRSTDGELAPLVSIRDYCGHPPSYALLSSNEWIAN